MVSTYTRVRPCPVARRPRYALVACRSTDAASFSYQALADLRPAGRGVLQGRVCRLLPVRRVSPGVMRPSSYPDTGCYATDYVPWSAAGQLSCNVNALVERAADDIPADDDAATAAKSWTVEEVRRFRVAAHAHRRCACWLMPNYEIRRPKFSGFDARGSPARRRRSVGRRRNRHGDSGEPAEVPPDPPRPPAELAEALRAPETAPKRSHRASGGPTSA